MTQIAVIGISTLFPGSKTPEEFWQTLVNNQDCRRQATQAQMGVEANTFLGKKGDKDKYYCTNGGYIENFSLDADGLDIGQEEIDQMDDLFKWPLYVAREALRDSGYHGNSDVLKQCGIILGNLSFPTKSSNQLFVPVYHQTLNQILQDVLQDESFSLPRYVQEQAVSPLNALISGLPAAMVAKALNLSGVNFALDAACASSLYSTKLACDYLKSGRANLMLAGAVSAGDPMFVNMGFSIFQAYPENQISAPLDTRSEGLFAGEGAGMLVLKRLDDALADGDKIYATILGGGLSNDGKGHHVLSPNTKGQVTCFQRAYQSAGIDPSTIDYVECHATGTPLGDKIELTSLENFFAETENIPKVGSVKSNLGHLLSAAGMPGMTKVILGMENGLIPATINIEQPQSSPNNKFNQEQIVMQNCAWPEKQDNEKRRAGVSVFGFGGANAHLVFEEPQKTNGNTPKPKAISAKHVPTAIVGMDAHFGDCESLKELDRSSYNLEQHFRPLPKTRWSGMGEGFGVRNALADKNGDLPQGAYIENFDLDFLRFKIPPNEDDRLIPQQLLLMKVADQAIKEANLMEGANVAVLVAMGTELELHRFRGRGNLPAQFREAWKTSKNIPDTKTQEQVETLSKDGIHGHAKLNQYTSSIGNIMASRVSSLWDFSGPAFTVSAEENSVYRAIEVAQTLFATSDVEAVVVGSVDLAGSLENVLLRNMLAKINRGKISLGFDRESSGWSIGEGAGALVLKRQETALANKDKIYAVIEALEFSEGTDAKAIETACENALESASAVAHDIEFIEVFDGGIPEQENAEITGLLNAYQNEHEVARTAIGSIKANVGHTFNASGMASIIRTALALYNRYIPGIPQWEGPKDPRQWQDGPFYMPTTSKVWHKEQGKKRMAGINGLGQDGQACHLILSEHEDSSISRSNDYLYHCQEKLIVASGNDEASVLNLLKTIQADLEKGTPLGDIANQCYQQSHSSHAYAVSLIALDRKQFAQEIKAALQGIPKSLANKEEWQTPAGSYFTPVPLGQEGKLAYVFPGAFNSYLNIGKDLFQLFPELYPMIAFQTSDFPKLVGDRIFYPRTLNKMTPEEYRATSIGLTESPINMFENGISFAVSYTEIVRELFNLKADVCFGYSMGEISMMYAMGIWGKTDYMSGVLRSTPVFQTRLAGRMDTLRDAWKLPAETPDGSFWMGYALKASPEDTQKAIGDDAYVKLILINTRSEVIIAGKPDACRKVIDKLGCDSFPAALGDVIHCDLVRADYDGLANLHRMEISKQPDATFYSAVGYQPLKIEAEHVANNIAEMYCNPVDFPRLVETAYEDNTRIFVELGPRDGCTRYITETLADKPHLAVATNRKGVSDYLSLIRAFGKLYSHRVDLSLQRLYPEATAEPTKRQLNINVVNGDIPVRKRIADGFKPLRKTKPIALPEAQQNPGPSTTKTQKIAPLAAPAVHDNAMRTNAAIPLSQYQNNMSRVNVMHTHFLAARQASSEQMAKLIAIQTNALVMQEGNAARSLPASVSFEKGHGQEIVQKPLPAQRPADVTPIQTQKIKPAKRSGRSEMTKTMLCRGPEQYQRVQEPRKLHHAAPLRAKRSARVPGEIWDAEDLREFAEGNIANVFGPDYASIDQYGRRVRLPTTEYLLVTRVTQLDAEIHKFEPCSMTTEYDIPYDAWYAVDGQIPCAVAVESGQCDLMLISYLGIDFQNKGDRIYRLLDCTLTFLDDIAVEGETLRYDININSYAESGGALLFFFSYDCYIDDQLVLTMRNGAAGFFSDQELAEGKGVIYSNDEIEAKETAQKQSFTPLLECPKRTFDFDDMLKLCRGDVAGCFGPEYDAGGTNPELVYTATKMLMIERITKLDPKGGPYGLGLIVGEKDLAPEHWYFPCHFKDDQVMAGSLMSDGCGQLLRFYAWFLGMHTKTQNARFQPFPGLPQKVRCRGQVTPQHGTLIYRMEVKEIGLDPLPYAIADVEIILNGKIVVDFRDLGLMLKEEENSAPTSTDITLAASKWPINLPDVDFKSIGLSAHSVSQPSFTNGLYAARKPPFKPFSGQLEDANTVPDTVPYTWYHFTEFATGRVANCFGEEYAVYDGRTPPRTPNSDLQLTTRVIEVQGERHNFKKEAYCVAEFDCPSDAWFFQQNTHNTFMPYSIIMEIALQPCGFISAWCGSTLTSPDADLFFRNLDGSGHLLKNIDVRGKTIRNKSTLISTTIMAKTIIQNFTFEMSVDGEAFYEGTAVFGYFLKDALTHQLGLDGGKITQGWHLENNIPSSEQIVLDLNSKQVQQEYFQAKEDKPFYHLAGPQLHLVDKVTIVKKGGKEGKGYIYADRIIDTTDWFFTCHFHQDPVMPGSLGVEAMFQILQVYALEQDLGKQFSNPRFNHIEEKIKWKYRGQITPANQQMSLDLHITNIQITDSEVRMVADGNLSKDGLRIYELTDLILCIEEA